MPGKIATVGDVGKSTLRGEKVIDQIWFDVSVLLLLPPGYISGISRTVRKIMDVWRRNPWTEIRYVAVLPGKGFAEVNPASLFPNDAISSDPARGPRRPHSRYWYLPWSIRHKYRATQKNLRKFWYEPAPGSTSSAFSASPYPDGSLMRPVALGPRDLLFSLGGLWVVPEVSESINRTKRESDFTFASLIYDLIPFFAPHYCSPTHVLPSFGPCTMMQLNESDLIVTISNYSKLDILKFSEKEYLPTGSVEVFTLGSDIKPIDAATAAATPQQHTRPFVLSVGSVEVRKNHYGMYQAWRKLVKTLGPDRTPDLVLAGKPGWQGESILYLIQNDPLVKDKIVVKSGIGDRELDWLYKNCLFTLYPSLYEGWGLPVEESFIYGKMCVTTNATSLPEVGGNFADYVEPEDVDAIVRGVLKGLDVDYRAARERNIRENYVANTWEKSAEQLEAILRNNYNIRGLRKAEPRVPAAPQKGGSLLTRALAHFW